MGGIVLVNGAVVGFAVGGELIELAALDLGDIKLAVTEVDEVLGAAGLQELCGINRIAVIVSIVIELIVLGLDDANGTVVPELGNDDAVVRRCCTDAVARNHAHGKRAEPERPAAERWSGDFQPKWRDSGAHATPSAGEGVYHLGAACVAVGA